MAIGIDGFYPEGQVFVTYDNLRWADGVGAQLQRVYGTYALSRLIGVNYLHSPLNSINWGGMDGCDKTAEELAADLAETNSLFNIPSDTCQGGQFLIAEVESPSLDYFKAISIERKNRGMPILVKMLLPYAIMDAIPVGYEFCKNVSPFLSNMSGGRKLVVAIHVRRGEIVSGNRFMPNSYYINIARRLCYILDGMGISYQVDLHTELPKKSRRLNKDYFGKDYYVNIPDPSVHAIEEFDVIPNLVKHINGPAIGAIRGMATADILVTGKSSFSYLGGILNKNALVLYTPFWHAPLPSWLVVDDAGCFNEASVCNWLASRPAVPMT